MKTLLLLILSLSLNAVAGVILPEATHFETTGEVSSFQWAPDRYRSDFRYDVLYYIPESIKDKSSVKTLIMMHGGGQSTLTREGSLRTAKIYMNLGLTKLAEELQMIVVVPSASGLNWGGHTVGMIRDLNQLLRKELSVDHNNMGLAGHSMGGMGIGRSYLWLADEFAYFLPIAAGIDSALQTTHHLNKAFNVPYVHLQGVKDHFKIFIERCIQHLNNIANLEILYDRKSKFELVFYDGDHDYSYDLLKSHVARLQLMPRNLFQRKLYGSLYYNDNFYTENNITYHQNSSRRYFWIELIEATGSGPKRMDFTASIRDNTVHLNYDVRPPEFKRLRIRLSERLIDRNKPVYFYENGRLLLKLPKMRNRLHQNRLDKAYTWSDSVDYVWK